MNPYLKIEKLLKRKEEELLKRIGINPESEHKADERYRIGATNMFSEIILLIRREGGIMGKKEPKYGKPIHVEESDPTPDSMINECIFPIKADYFAKLVDTAIPSVKQLQCNSCDGNIFRIFVCNGTIAAVCPSCNSMIILGE